MNLNTSTCMQYAASFLAVKFQFSNQIFGDMHVNIFFFQFGECFISICVTAEACHYCYKNSIDASNMV